MVCVIKTLSSRLRNVTLQTANLLIWKWTSLSFRKKTKSHQIDLTSLYYRASSTPTTNNTISVIPKTSLLFASSPILYSLLGRSLQKQAYSGSIIAVFSPVAVTLFSLTSSLQLGLNSINNMNTTNTAQLLIIRNVITHTDFLYL